MNAQKIGVSDTRTCERMMAVSFPHSRPYHFAEQLERAMGDPLDPSCPASFARAVELDEKEEFPSEFIELLRSLDVHRFLIPREIGGLLQSFEESLAILRLIARRDLTAAIAFGQTFLGAIPVWLSGSEGQRHALASSISDGDLGCLALTEEAHGGDLMATEFRAAPCESGYLLSGRKWLINNGVRGGFASVFAATSTEPSFSGFTLFLLDRRSGAVAEGLSPLPRVRTHGIRGADISGFECRRLRAPESAVIGSAGRGYEITLKTLQISRTMCAALSLGAADTALRAALDFALRRRVFGDTVSAIPSARDQLTGAYADLLMCDCLALAAARALDCAVSRMSVWSSIVKYFVPTTTEDLVRDAAVVLGARHYLREGHFSGVFQKAMRDNAVVGLFDGSSAVNLHIISGQLGALAAGRKRLGATPDSQAAARLRDLFSLREHLSARGFPRDSDLTFTNDGRDEIVEGLSSAFQAELPEEIAELLRLLRQELERVDRSFEALREAGDRRVNSSARFDLARRYCRISAAAASVQMWIHNRGAGDDFFNGGAWLNVILHRVLARLNPDTPEAPPSAREQLFEHMTAQFERGDLFSVSSIRLAGTARR
jgi:alkylation response protein AidB-like acyl-CoA dehydrogenase